MHYYSFHIADFALHTSHLTLEEEAVFRRLLDHYYDTESPIPRETQRVIRRLRLVSYAEIVQSILSEFFVLQDDGWHNLRADAEILDYNEKAIIARTNGKKGGRPKKNKELQNEKPRITQPVILANPDVTQPKPNHKPITNNHKPLEKARPTAQDVADYVATREVKIDPQRFVDHYTANGWKVGRNSMKDWKAAVRTWEKSENGNTKNTINGFTDSRRLSGAERTRLAREQAFARERAAASFDMGRVEPD